MGTLHSSKPAKNEIPPSVTRKQGGQRGFVFMMHEHRGRPREKQAREPREFVSLQT